MFCNFAERPLVAKQVLDLRAALMTARAVRLALVVPIHARQHFPAYVQEASLPKVPRCTHAHTGTHTRADTPLARVDTVTRGEMYTCTHAHAHTRAQELVFTRASNNPPSPSLN